MICAIHQPNFFPWLGFFDKIVRSDVFVLLDNVQVSKNTGTWCNRVGFNISSNFAFFTAPIKRPSGFVKINEIYFNDVAWREKLVKTLQANYAKAIFYKEHKDFIFELILNKENHLSSYNINAITSLCKYFGIDTTKFVLSSSLNLKTHSNQLLIDLTKATNCKTYMAGGGASEYQDVSMFKAQDLGFVYQDFVHPTYAQAKTKSFVKALSVIDCIFNTNAIF